MANRANKVVLPEGWEDLVALVLSGLAAVTAAAVPRGNRGGDGGRGAGGAIYVAGGTAINLTFDTLHANAARLGPTADPEDRAELGTAAGRGGRGGRGGPGGTGGAGYPTSHFNPTFIPLARAVPEVPVARAVMAVPAATGEPEVPAGTAAQVTAAVFMCPAAQSPCPPTISTAIPRPAVRGASEASGLPAAPRPRVVRAVLPARVDPADRSGGQGESRPDYGPPGRSGIPGGSGASGAEGLGAAGGNGGNGGTGSGGGLFIAGGSLTLINGTFSGGSTFWRGRSQRRRWRQSRWHRVAGPRRVRGRCGRRRNRSRRWRSHACQQHHRRE